MIPVKIEPIATLNKGKACFVTITPANAVTKIPTVDKANVINRLRFVTGSFLIFNCMV